jgi:hypothetical protein
MILGGVFILSNLEKKGTGKTPIVLRFRKPKIDPGQGVKVQLVIET